LWTVYRTRRPPVPSSSRPARWRSASSTRRHSSRSSPVPTSPAGAERPQRTCAGCRAGGATRSTRWSCAPATSSCTSSTASAGTWRWCAARSTVPSASTWSSSTRRPSAASPATGCSYRPTSSTSSPGTSRGVADGTQAGRLRLGQVEGPGAQGGPRDRGTAHPALRRAAERAGPRLRPGHAVAAGAGGRLPVRRDAGPALRDRGGQGGHGEVRYRWTG
jgi:hypothetical protein